MNRSAVKAEPAHDAGEPYTHRDALAALSEAEITRLKEPRDGPGLLRLAGHLGVLAICTTSLILLPLSPIWVLALGSQGIALIFLFTLEHEGIHGTAFRTPWLNRVAAAVTGFLIAVPPRWFRYFHFAHHRFTQDPASDPELASPKPKGWVRYGFYLTGLPYWYAEFATLFRMAFRGEVGSYVPGPAKDKVVAESRLFLLGYAAIAAASIGIGWTWPLVLWVLPALVGQPFLRAYLLAEHGACPLVADMLANTRTTFTNRAVRFIAWNMPYHTAHHVLPVVPFHRLPELTAILRERLSSTASGYADAHRQIRAQWSDSGSAHP